MKATQKEAKLPEEEANVKLTNEDELDYTLLIYNSLGQLVNSQLINKSFIVDEITQLLDEKPLKRKYLILFMLFCLCSCSCYYLSLFK